MEKTNKSPTPLHDKSFPKITLSESVLESDDNIQNIPPPTFKCDNELLSVSNVVRFANTDNYTDSPSKMMKHTIHNRNDKIVKKQILKKPHHDSKTSIFDRRPGRDTLECGCQTEQQTPIAACDEQTNNEQYDEEELEQILFEISKLIQSREFTKVIEELYNFKNKFKNLNQRLLFKWNLMMGSCKFEKKELQDATKFYIECLDLHENYQLDLNMTVIAKINNILGLIYTSLGEYNLALTVFQTALQIYKDADQAVLFAEVINNMGLLYLKANMIRESYDFLLEAFRIKKEAYGNNSVLLNSTILNISQCLKLMECYQKALALLKYLEQSYKKSLTKTEDHKIADIWRRMAQIQHMRGNLNEALELCNRARDLLVISRCTEMLEYGHLMDAMGLLVLDKDKDKTRAREHMQEANRIYSIYLAKQNQYRVKLGNNLFLIENLDESVAEIF